MQKIRQNDLSGYLACKKAVLAYSGGLDTSVILKVLLELGLEVFTLTVDLGQDEYKQQGLKKAAEKALSIGASKAFVIDAKKEFVDDYVNKAIKSNCLYQGIYPCSTAIGRPLIAKHLVACAEKIGAGAVVHGSTGKGNDYLRFHVSVKALSPGLEILAPVRDWQLNRSEEISFAISNGIQVPATKSSPYSVDANLWGRSSEGGVIEQEDAPVPADVLGMVTPPENAPSRPAFAKIFFEKGIPVKAGLDGETISGEVALIQGLNKLAGSHGIGIIDHIEDRTIGLKSREYYECPAAAVILKAHKDIEQLCLPKELNSLKPFVDQKFAEFCYSGLWYSPAMDAVNAFVKQTQESVSGWVELKLYKGSCSVLARRAPNGLYRKKAASYSASSFDQSDSKGFANFYALSTVTACMQKG